MDQTQHLPRGSEAGHLRPMSRLNEPADTTESIVDTLPGYRGLGPVRIGNQAYEQIQHDVYGSAVLAATHVFFDRRVPRKANRALFHELEPLGEKARRYWDQPHARVLVLRGSEIVC